MAKRASVVFCLLLFFFSGAIPANASPATTEATIAWERMGVAFSQTMLERNNRLYLSSDGLRQLGFEVRWRKADNRFLLDHADEGMRQRFAPVYYRDQVIVLMYHALADEPENDGILAAADFRRQMQLLKDKGFNVIGMDRYADFVLHGAPVPDNAVLLTFDDGYENFYTHAYPVLREFGFPAVNFVIVKWIDEPYGLPKLTWDQMREMQAHGMRFYSHTYDSHIYGQVDEAGRTRPVLTNRLYLEEEGRRETEEEYAARVLADLSAAEARLRKELGNELGVLSFPYGAFNERVLELAEQAGIALTFTIKDGINGADDRNGFRVNAGYRGNDGREMVARMQRGLCDGEACGPAVYFGEDPLRFTDGQPFVADGKLWLPLRELMQQFGLRIKPDLEAGLVSIY